MPYTQPSRGDVHVNTPLTNLSYAAFQDASGFVADKAFPNIPVMNQSNVYYTYDEGEFNRDEMEDRTPGTESAGGSYTVSNSTYHCVTKAFHKDIPEQVRANADGNFNLDQEATLFVTTKALIKREVTWVANFFTAGAPGDTWTFDVDGASSATAAGSFDPTNASNNDKLYWDDASSTPIEDIRQGKRYVTSYVGGQFKPNVLITGRQVFDTLLDHPDIVGRLDRGQTQGPAMATREALAALLELDEILVMDAVVNTAKKGATKSSSFIGGKHALLAYRPMTPGLLTPSAGYTFSWTGLLGNQPNGIRIKKWWSDDRASDRVEAEQSYDQKVIGADLGYFFGNIVQ